MCLNIEDAKRNCRLLFGHECVAQADYPYTAGCWHACDDTEWIIDPDSYDCGVLGLKKLAIPLCVRATVLDQAAA